MNVGGWAEGGRMVRALTDARGMQVAPRKVRQSLDVLAEQLKGLPNRMRQYAAYEHVQATIRGHLKANTLVVELRSDALRERHWKALMTRLRVHWALAELTLGDVWRADLLANEKAVREVLVMAQGEMALEMFLAQLRETWGTYEVELIAYQNTTRLVRGWDDLFSRLKEHQASLQAMKLSPYYKVFAEDAAAWEDKLNRITALLDAWVDVQRRWVYLESIFTSSADIRTLLPMETSRFGGINTEFLGLMKKVVKAPLLLDIINIPQVQVHCPPCPARPGLQAALLTPACCRKHWSALPSY